MKITFKKLKKISEDFEIGNDQYFLNFINDFSGNNIYEKFMTILRAWERDVSYDMNMNMNGRDMKVALYYIINEFENFNDEDLILTQDNLKFHINIPEKWEEPKEEIFSNSIIKKIQWENQTINFNESMLEYVKANTLNNLYKVVTSDKKTIKLSNPNMNLKLNFLTYEPFYFLKGMFDPFSKDYFREIIYHLSQKIGERTLFNSTILDIDYFIEKLSKEQSEKDIPTI